MTASNKTDVLHHLRRSLNENDEFVIAGVSGRFPEANSMDEFASNLFSGVDMVTADSRRWPTGNLSIYWLPCILTAWEGIFGLPTRNGKLKEVDRFDAAFFNIHPKQAHNMDPQLRLLLEVTYESICDAGIEPNKLKGTNTGVFIGASCSEAQNAFSSDPQTLDGYSMIGCATSMLANRLSYFFDLKGMISFIFNRNKGSLWILGPSYTVDTGKSM
jgi:fatty acid synthase, animal type